MSPWAALLLGLVLSYLIGSIPTSYIAGRLMRGIDIRNEGSGNLGATNAYRVLGLGAAIPVLIVDIGKGVLAVLLGLSVLPSIASVPDLVPLVCAIGAILGHSLSPFVGFRGGKGVATAAGAFFTLAPWAALPALGVWLVLLLSTRIMSIASVAAATVLPVNLLSYDLLRHDAPPRWSTFVVAVLVAAWVILRHRSNLQRLREGKENVLW